MLSCVALMYVLNLIVALMYVLNLMFEHSIATHSPKTWFVSGKDPVATGKD